MTDRPSGDFDLLSVLWRHKLPLVACVVFAGFVGYALSHLLPVRYTAQSRVFLSSAAPFEPLNQRSSGNNQQRYVVQQAELMSSRAVLDLARLPPTTSQDELAQALEITPSADSDLVIVSATADRPEEAAAIANAVARAFQEFTAELVADEAERAVAAVTDPAQAEQIRAAAAVYGDGVSVVDRAQVPSAPSEPSPLRNAVLLAAFSGLVYALAAVLPAAVRPAAHEDDQLGQPDQPEPGEPAAPAAPPAPAAAPPRGASAAPVVRLPTTRTAAKVAAVLPGMPGVPAVQRWPTDRTERIAGAEAPEAGIAVTTPAHGELTPADARPHAG